MWQKFDSGKNFLRSVSFITGVQQTAATKPALRVFLPVARELKFERSMSDQKVHFRLQDVYE
jgi:hypothetical protein